MKIENKKKQMNEKWMENDAVFVVVIIFSPPQPLSIKTRKWFSNVAFDALGKICLHSLRDIFQRF